MTQVLLRLMVGRGYKKILTGQGIKSGALFPQLAACLFEKVGLDVVH